MNIKRMQDNWNEWGETDPLFAILTDPQKQGGKWQLEEFSRPAHAKSET